MGLFSRTFKILTCGYGPICREKLKTAIKYNSWSLKWQIVFAVSVFLLGLQVIIQSIGSMLFARIFENITEDMTGNITLSINNNFISQSTAIETNIMKLILNWDTQLVKLSDLLEESIESSYFKSEYPLKYEDQELTTYPQLLRSDEPYELDVNDNEMFFRNSSYFLPYKTISSETKEFARKAFVLQTVWSESLEISLGVDHNIQLNNFIFGYYVNTTGCGDKIVVKFPGMKPPPVSGGSCSEDKDLVEASTMVNFEGMDHSTEFFLTTYSMHVGHGETGYMGLLHRHELEKDQKSYFVALRARYETL